MKRTKFSPKGSNSNIRNVSTNCKLGNSNNNSNDKSKSNECSGELDNKYSKKGSSLPSVFEHLKGIPDYRNTNNYSNRTTYSISQLVVLCIIACLQEYSTGVGFVRFCKNNQTELLKLLDLTTLPSLATFSRLSKNVSFEQVNERLSKWLYDCIAFLSLEKLVSKVSIDGKYLKGYKSKDKDGKSNHQSSEQNMLASVSMFCQDLKIVLNSNTLQGKKESETYKFRELLDHSLVKLITGDSLHCNKQTLEKIDKLQKQYVIGLKGNCSKLKSTLDTFIQTNQPYATTTDNTKKVLRKVEVFDVSQVITNEKLQLKSWLNSNIQTYIKVTKTSKKTNQIQVNTYISNINPKTYTADEFAITIRNHWKVENNLHWQKDMIFGEDKHISNTLNSTFFFSTIYSFTIGVINLRNHLHNIKKSVLDTLRYNTNRLDRTLAVLNLKS